MRIALVHDYLKEIGGAETVLEALSDLFPDAPIYTTLYRPQNFGPHRDRLEKKWGSRIHQSFFKYIPFASKLISPLRLLSPLAFRLFNFQTFDLIITSATGAYFPNALNKKSAKLICYCHTPPRYLYGLPTARDLKKYPAFNALAEVANHFLRLLDFRWAQNVDQFIANSNTTSARIQKYYRRDSVVINPPINIPIEGRAQQSEVRLRRKHFKKSFKPFYLTGGRLARAKRYDIAIKACNKLKLPLKIFGRDFAGFEAELKSIAGPTVEFLGEVSESQKAQLFSQAFGYFFCSDNEDFGIVSVEAQSYGCPVIGYNSGGIAETVIDNRTGVLFDKLTVDSCIKAVQKLKQLKINPQDCVANAQNFSAEKFIAKMNKLINTSK